MQNVENIVTDLGGGKAGSVFFAQRSDYPPIPELDILKSLSARKTFSEQDAKILAEILDAVEKSSELPFPWSAQEANYIKRQPTEKWIDYLIYRFKFTLFPKRKIVTDFPIYLLIEPMSVCNLRCVMCFQVDKTFTKKPFMGMMDFELFKEVVDQAEEGGTQAITLASRGEPTLHPKLPAMLEYMSGKFVEVKLTTNATKLDEKLSHTILETGVNILVFSIDAHTKELYEEIRVQGKFDEVYANVMRFEEIRAKHYPDSSLSTRVSAVKFRQEQDPDGFVTFWSPIVDEVGMKPAAIRWNTYENERQEEVERPCDFLWERLYVWFDGIVNSCDPDYKSYLSPGSVKDLTIRELWHSEKLNALRNAHIQGTRRLIEPCDRCGMFT